MRKSKSTKQAEDRPTPEQLRKLRASLDGYKATSVLLGDLLNEQPSKKFRSTYDDGFRDGIATGISLLALGQYPDEPENAAKIQEVLAAVQFRKTPGGTEL